MNKWYPKEDEKRLNIGDAIGGIYPDGNGGWKLVKDKIKRIDNTRKYGRRYHTYKAFRPLDADEVDNNTQMMENAVGKGYILTNEVFGLNKITRAYADQWIAWANENPGRVISVLDDESEEKINVKDEL